MGGLLKHIRGKKAKPSSEYESCRQVLSGDDGLLIEAKIVAKVVTAQDCLLKVGLDPAVWQPVEINTTGGTIWVKDADNNPVESPIWFVKARFRRRVPEFAEGVAKHLEKVVPAIKLPSVRKPKSAGQFLVIGCADFHFGRSILDDDSTLARASRVFSGVVESMLSRVSGVNHIYFLNLGDLLNIDTDAGTTTRGTPQACSASFSDIFNAAAESLVKGIAACASVAPTTFMTAHGNHDWSAGQHLSTCMRLVFRNTKSVTVDDGSEPRKYIHRGRSLIAMSHGDKERPGSHAGLMMVERAREFADSSCRVFLTGHLHHKRALRRMETLENDGCVLYTLPSPAGLDVYHRDAGYVGAKRCCQGFVFDDEYGLTTIHEVTVQEALK